MTSQGGGLLIKKKKPMDHNQKCPICKSQVYFLGHGIIAPWIRKLQNQKIFQPTELLECQTCFFIFFSYRYSEDEIDKIYSKYRSSDYFNARHSYEFWYTSATNSHNLNLETIKQRKHLIAKYLKKAGIELDDLTNSTVDFAGDQGQFIPEIPGKKFLVDLSATAQFINGISIVNDLDQVPHPIDLIISQHFLEHVESPIDFLKMFMNHIGKKIATHRGGGKTPIIFLEIPMDHYKVSQFARTRTYKNYLKFLMNHKTLFIFVDFLSGLSRQYLGRLPFFGIIKQAEHINYFTTPTINYLSNDLKLRVLLSKDVTYRAGRIKFKSKIVLLQNS